MNSEIVGNKKIIAKDHKDKSPLKSSPQTGNNAASLRFAAASLLENSSTRKRISRLELGGNP